MYVKVHAMVLARSSTQVFQEVSTQQWVLSLFHVFLKAWVVSLFDVSALSILYRLEASWRRKLVLLTIILLDSR